MTVLLEQHLPVPREMIEAVSAHMGVLENPPAGLICHVAVAEGDGVRVVDIWNSQADFEAFAASRLGPAVEAVAAASGRPAPAEMPPVTFSEAFDLVRGR